MDRTSRPPSYEQFTLSALGTEESIDAETVTSTDPFNKKNWTLSRLFQMISSMPPSCESSNANDLVNFNGIRVKKSTIPTLVQFLVQCDPMTVPSGEELEFRRRESVSHLFRRSFQEGESEPVILSAFDGDGDALRYLTGLMASRV